MMETTSTTTTDIAADVAYDTAADAATDIAADVADDTTVDDEPNCDESKDDLKSRHIFSLIDHSGSMISNNKIFAVGKSLSEQILHGNDDDLYTAIAFSERKTTLSDAESVQDLRTKPDLMKWFMDNLLQNMCGTHLWKALSETLQMVLEYGKQNPDKHITFQLLSDGEDNDLNRKPHYDATLATLAKIEETLGERFYIVMFGIGTAAKIKELGDTLKVSPDNIIEVAADPRHIEIAQYAVAEASRMQSEGRSVSARDMVSEAIELDRQRTITPDIQNHMFGMHNPNLHNGDGGGRS
jgi:hypothetical protein